MTAPPPRARDLTEWVWCERYGVRLIGHRDALDGSPTSPLCNAEHFPLAIVRDSDVRHQTGPNDASR